MERKIFALLSGYFGESFAESYSVVFAILAIALLAWLSYIVCVKIMTPLVKLVTYKTETTWDDDLLNPQVLQAFSQLAPAILVAVMLPGTFSAYAGLYVWITRFTKIYILWAAIHLIMVFLRSLQGGLDKRHLFRRHNLEILRQTLALFIIIIGVIVGIGILVNRDPMAILTGLGASAAILMLVFRDTILSFVAGIQLTVNRMLGKGDWIVAPKAGANGEVVEVKLTTVKVRNWDNSIVTIPPYTLFTDSFQNFQAMRQSGARRVSRSVLIDVKSIRYLESDEIEALRQVGFVPEKFAGCDSMVNLSLFRHYLEDWLEHYPEVINPENGRPELTLMVRQLQPTPQGVPLELYFFTSRTQWKPFEHLQADVFDHLFAVIGYFSLSIYQAPSHVYLSE